MPLLRVAFAIACTVISCSHLHLLLAQNHKEACWKPSGTSATLIVSVAPIDAYPDGTVVSLHSPTGGCSDAAVLRGGRAALTAWGDDPKTGTADGFRSGDTFAFRVDESGASRTGPAAVALQPSFRADEPYLERSTSFVPGAIYRVVLSSERTANTTGSTRADSTTAASRRGSPGEAAVDSVEALRSQSGDDGRLDINPGRPVAETALISVFPNPASHSAHIEFAVADGMTASLHLYDVLGRRIRHGLASRSFSAGRYRIREDLAGLASGVYIIRLTTGRSMHDRLLHVVRGR